MIPLILDTETANLDAPPKGGVCEIAWMILDDDGEIKEQDRSLIDPQVPINHAATAIHGIFDKDVTEAPTLEEYFAIVQDEKFSSIGSAKPYLFIAHNEKFDWRYVAPYIFSNRRLCTLRLARKLYPDAENHQLQTLRVALDLPFVLGDAHSALGDVEVVRQFLLKVNRDFGHTLDEMIELSKPEPLTASSKVTFGKHKGVKWLDVPSSYVKWLLKQDGTDDELVKLLRTL